MAVSITTLENGMRIVSDPLPHVETASIGVWVDVGARYEKAEENGLSHLLEHMAFKGTERRSSLAIAEEIEAVGGYMNAFTSREHTTYLARVLKEDVALAVDVLGDIIQNSTYAEAELAKEKEVIVQEINQTIDTPDDLVFDNLQEVAFPDQPLGRSILGTVDRVKGFSRDDIAHYLDKYYKTGAMVVAASGNIDHQMLVDLVTKTFSDIPQAGNPDYQLGLYKGGEMRVERPLEQLHLTLGLPGIAFNDPDFYAMQVFSTILGGGMSSRLFQEIRENRGLAYNVYSFSSSHADSGLFGIYAATNPNMVQDAASVIAEELYRLMDNCEQRELDRARTQLKAGLLMSLESTSSRMEQLGRQMLLFGRPLSAQELIERVDQVDLEAMQRIGKRLLSAPLSVATVGKTGTLSDLSSLQSLFSGRV